MWILIDKEEGVIGTFTDEVKANKEYEEQKNTLRSYQSHEMNAPENDYLFLTKVEKSFLSFNTNIQMVKSDGKGGTIPVPETYWDYKEEKYD